MFINLKKNHNLTEIDLDEIDIISQLEYQIQQLEMKESGWRFDKINSMTIFFYQIGIMTGSVYLKKPLRSSAIINNENNDKYCFLWSIFAHFQPCNKNHPNGVSNYKQYSNELNIEGFDFTNRFKCSDVQRFNEVTN